MAKQSMLDSKDFSLSWLDNDKEEKVVKWALNLEYGDIPPEVLNETKRAVLDTIGTALGAQKLEITKIVNKFIRASFPGSQAKTWFSGHPTSALGAALANGLITDGLDMHDTGHYTKGHAGAAIIPCAFACLGLVNGGKVSGKDFLTSLVAAYEVGYRCGHAMHESQSDFHSRTWRLTKFHVYKKFAVCYWAQPSIAGTISVMKKNKIKPEDVESIVCHTFKEATGLQQNIPTNTEEAQYCILYPIAAAAYSGKLGPNEVNGSALQDEKILALAKKVKILVDENLTSEAGDPELKGKDTASMTANIAWVEVTTKDGKTYKGDKARVPWDRLAGEPAPGDDEITGKFMSLGSDVGVEEKLLKSVVSKCLKMENESDVMVGDAL
eukprot:jgi/Bigna1/76354/fgenesh1_pg.40_\